MTVTTVASHHIYTAVHAGLPGLELEARPAYTAQRIDLPLVAAGGSALAANPAVYAARREAVVDAVKRARTAEGLPADVWRVKQPKRAKPTAAAASIAPAPLVASSRDQGQAAAATAGAAEPRKKAADPRKRGDPRKR
jgi:hypothetical protein